MKLILNKEKKRFKKNVRFGVINGYVLPSRGNKFKILNNTIINITVTNKKLAHPFVMLQVNTRFKKLINKVVDLLVEDEEGADTAELVLNQIEYFRQLIKKEYRYYLGKKELEKMAKELAKYQREAKKRINARLRTPNRMGMIGRGR